MVKHAEVLIAISQGKPVEVYNEYEPVPRWEQVVHLAQCNPITHAKHKWRVMLESPKKEWWESYFVQHNLPLDRQVAFYEGWKAALLNQVENHGMDEEDFEILNR
jgi:hypothetical protein